MKNRTVLYVLTTAAGLVLWTGCGGGTAKPVDKDADVVEGDVEDVGDVGEDADIHIEKDQKQDQAEVEEIEEVEEATDATDVVTPASCETTADCEGNAVCLPVGEDSARVCAPACEDGCPEGWECKEVQGAGNAAVSVCVPELETLCQPCTKNSDCIYFGAVCILGSGTTGYCGQACEPEASTCPAGFACQMATDKDGEPLSNQCMAEAGSCCVSGTVETCDDQNECTLDYCDASLGCKHDNQDVTCTGEGEACTEYKCVEGECKGFDITEDYSFNGVDDDCDGVVDDEWATGLNIPHYWFRSTMGEMGGEGWKLQGSLSVPGVTGVVTGQGYKLTPVTVKLTPVEQD